MDDIDNSATCVNDLAGKEKIAAEKHGYKRNNNLTIYQ